jgi:hypothetical protein
MIVSYVNKLEMASTRKEAPSPGDFTFLMQRGEYITELLLVLIICSLGIIK